MSSEVKRVSMYLTKDIWNWADEYVGENKIKGSQGNISKSQLVRDLLENKRAEVEKERAKAKD
jgi:hypothetical protein